MGSGGASVNGIWGPDENGELALLASEDAGDGGHKIQGFNDAGQVLVRADLELAPDGFAALEGVLLGTPDEFRAAAAENVPALSPRGRVVLALALLAVFLLGLRRK